MTNKKFYEEECLPRVKRIATEINELANSILNSEEAEERVEELEELVADNEEHEMNEYLEEELEELKTKLENEEPFNLYEYFEDYLDVEFRINSRGEYNSVAVTLATGGPHIEVDTKDMLVKLWWGSNRAEWTITSKARDIIDDIFEEAYSCL